jgi:hypothetical protein
MIKVVINEKEYRLPTLMEEISSEKGFDIEKLLEEDYQGNKTIEFKKWVLAILIGCDYDVIDLVTDDQINLIVDNHIFFKNINGYLPKYIIVNHKINELIDYDNEENIMTVENYGLLDGLLEKSYNNYEKIFKYLYKPAKIGLFKGIYFRIFNKNYKSVNHIQYLIIKSLMYYHIGWKLKLLKEYGLSAFDDNMAPEQQEEIFELNTIEKIFGFYHLLMIASNKNIQTADWWLNRDVRELFQFIRYANITNI